MKLNFEQIKEITLGAVSVQMEDSMVSFRRFTKEQEALYELTNRNHYVKTFSTAGIKFMFKTDNNSLFLKVRMNLKACRYA